MVLRDLVKRFLPADPYAPSLIRQLFSAPYRRHHAIGRLVRRATGGAVAGGPFRGLRYVDRAVGSLYAAKLLGTYEKELEGVIGQIIQRGYPLVIDIGAAEGYYAVGLAARLPQAQVIAFEAQTRQHRVLRELARRNGVDQRITLQGLGTTERLREALSTPNQGPRPVLVVCDIEGSESDLLDPTPVPELQHADALVELHELEVPGIGELIRSRFAKSHRITEIHTRPRTLEDWPAGVELDPSLRLHAMHEGRPGEMSWLWMEAKG